jgi:single-strand DNA-binding protein
MKMQTFRPQDRLSAEVAVVVRLQRRKAGFLRHAFRKGGWSGGWKAMRDVNKVMLMGRLGSDPVQRQTPSGVMLTRFSVATSKSLKRSEGESAQEERETVWHRVVAWGKEAENCARFLKKGSSVFVEGTIRQNRYKTSEGEDRTGFEVHADRVSFLGSSAGRRAIEQEAAMMN